MGSMNITKSIKIISTLLGLLIFIFPKIFADNLKKNVFSIFNMESSTMEKGYMNLSGDQYWEVFANPDFKPIMDKYAPERKPGIFIDLPKNVNIDHHTDIPLYGIRIVDTYFNYHQPFDRFGIVIITNTSLNQAYAGQIIRRKNPDTPIKPKNRNEFRENSFTGIKFKAKLKERVPEIQFIPGTYNCTIVLFNQISNTISLKITSESSEEKPYIANNPKETLLSRNDIKFDTGNFKHPSVENNPLSIVSPKGTFCSKDTDLVLTVTYKIKLSTSMILDDGTFKLFILISGNTSAGPDLLALKVPLNLLPEKNEKEFYATGKFYVNVSKYSNLLRLKQTCVFYALAGDAMSAPVTVEVLD